MGSLYQVLDIIFEVQRKRSNEKLTRIKIGFSTYKMFFFFLLFVLHLLSNLITFLFIIQFKQLKFYKSSLNSNSNKSNIQESFWMFGTTYVMFIGLFFNFWPPLVWGVVTFSFLICFQRLLICQIHQEERFKFCYQK